MPTACMNAWPDGGSRRPLKPLRRHGHVLSASDSVVARGTSPLANGPHVASRRAADERPDRSSSKLPNSRWCREKRPRVRHGAVRSCSRFRHDARVVHSERAELVRPPQTRDFPGSNLRPIALEERLDSRRWNRDEYGSAASTERLRPRHFEISEHGRAGAHGHTNPHPSERTRSFSICRPLPRLVETASGAITRRLSPGIRARICGVGANCDLHGVTVRFSNATAAGFRPGSTASA